MSLDIPPQFSLCQNTTCSQASHCLRHLAYQQRPTDKTFIAIVNPSCYPPEGENCPFFRSNEPIQLAWGIKELLDTIPHGKAKQIKEQLIATFGKSKFYRVLREESALTPQQQQIIQKLFLNLDIDTPPAYKRLTQAYQWFPDWKSRSFTWFLPMKLLFHTEKPIVS